ncbi:hypothetical protein GCM10022246_34860 [Pedobacter ginsengiterrae]|uniref:Uncharacterized protein n=1 Tax=Pedobacter ginsengiterrae TaxID=871696 RepID=A0ABP7QBS0_9SPHI|nr:hypothetical protein [Pedobacter aquatilis]
MELPKNIRPNNDTKAESGLDNWNDRLDENLEPEDENDVSADSRAKAFSEKYKDKEEADDSGN